MGSILLQATNQAPSSCPSLDNLGIPRNRRYALFQSVLSRARPSLFTCLCRHQQSSTRSMLVVATIDFPLPADNERLKRTKMARASSSARLGSAISPEESSVDVVSFRYPHGSRKTKIKNPLLARSSAASAQGGKGGRCTAGQTWEPPEQTFSRSKAQMFLQKICLEIFLFFSSVKPLQKQTQKRAPIMDEPAIAATKRAYAKLPAHPAREPKPNITGHMWMNFPTTKHHFSIQRVPTFLLALA